MADYPHNEYVDFVSFIMIHAAAADHEMAQEEKDFIAQKISRLEYREIRDYYKTLSDESRMNYMKAMKEKWLKTDEGKNSLLEKVIEVMGIDHSVAPEEKKVYAEIKDLIFG